MTMTKCVAASEVEVRVLEEFCWDWVLGEEECLGAQLDYRHVVEEEDNGDGVVRHYIRGSLKRQVVSFLKTMSFCLVSYSFTYWAWFL